MAIPDNQASNTVGMLGEPALLVRHARERIWSSAAYRWARGTIAELTRPLRRLELCIVYRYDLTQPIAPFEAGVDVRIDQASLADLEEASRLRVPHDPGVAKLFRCARSTTAYALSLAADRKWSRTIGYGCAPDPKRAR